MDIEVIRDRPSGAIAMPSSSVGPDVNCSGGPSGKHCRHKCRRPSTRTAKYIQVPSGDHAAAEHRPGGPACLPAELPFRGTKRHGLKTRSDSTIKTHWRSGEALELKPQLSTDTGKYMSRCSDRSSLAVTTTLFLISENRRCCSSSQLRPPAFERNSF